MTPKVVALTLILCASMRFVVKLVDAHNPHDVVGGLLASDDGKFALAIVRGLMYRTVDGGFSWELAHTGLHRLQEHGSYTLVSTPLASATDKSNAIIFLLHNTFLDKELFRSNNLGQTWTNVWSEKSKIRENLSVKPVTLAAKIALSINFSRDKTMAIAGDRLVVSKNGGATFEAIGGKRAFTTVVATRHGMVAGTNNGTILFLRTDGSPWAAYHDHGVDPITSLQLCDEAAAHATCLLVGSNHGVAKLVVSKSFAIQKQCILNAEQLNPKKQVPAKFRNRALELTKSMTEVLILPTGSRSMLVTSFLAALLTDTDGGKWENLGDKNGLHFTLPQMLEFKVPHYSHLAYSRTADKMWIGSYTGIYSSDDQGRTWIKLDVIAPYITGLDVRTGQHGGPFVSVCTYTAGCFGTELSTEKTISEGGLARVSVKLSSSVFQRYLVLKMSPNFQYDNIMLAASKQAGLLRSADGGATWASVSVTAQEAGNKYTIHSIEFSPNFEKDGTIFVSGFNVAGGLAISTNRGQTFKRFPHWERKFTKFATHCKLSLSPNFSYDQSTGHVHGSMLLTFADDHLSTVNEAHQWSTPATLRAQIHLSRDGKRFDQIASGYFDDLQFLNEDDILARRLPDDCTDVHCGGHLLVFKPRGQRVSFERVVDGRDFARNGLSADPKTGTIMAATQGGKVRVLTLVKKHTLEEKIEDRWSADSNIGQNLLPPDDSLRGMGTLIKAYGGGVCFGASANHILMSRDNGKTWNAVAKVPQTIRSGGLLEHCEYARNSEAPVLSHDSPRDMAFSDDGAYCLKCKDGVERDPAFGVCGGTHKAILLTSDPKDSDCDDHSQMSSGESTGRRLKIKLHAPL